MTTHEILCSVSLNDVNSSFVSIAIAKQYPDKRQPQVEQVYLAYNFRLLSIREALMRKIEEASYITSTVKNREREMYTCMWFACVCPNFPSHLLPKEWYHPK